MVNICGDLHCIVGQLQVGFFLGNLSNPHTSWHEYSLRATFFEKKTLADQNIKMTAIFQDVAILGIKIYVLE